MPDKGRRIQDTNICFSNTSMVSNSGRKSGRENGKDYT